MPFSPADRPYRRAVATEAVRFARLFRTIPVVKGWPNHPAVRPMARAFRTLNKALAKRDKRGYVSVAGQARMGKEFAKIGTALQQKRKARSTSRRAKKR